MPRDRTDPQYRPPIQHQPRPTAFDGLQHNCHDCGYFAGDDLLTTRLEVDPETGEEHTWYVHRGTCPPKVKEHIATVSMPL